jgi:hypothetical protein
MEDYEDRDPVPAPFTTLAWRLFHVASCKVMDHEWAFGPAELTWLTIERPETVEEWPTWRIFWTMIQHDAHHGGEIGCLRDLYFHRV